MSCTYICTYNNVTTHKCKSALHAAQHYGLVINPKTTTTKTTTATRSLDGELLWQREATEFIERFPQRRRPHGTLRPSASAGALYKKGTTITTINKRASGGELLTAQQRHQRDLFSGDLGIPEVRSHVGSMVHTFETLALQRKLADQERAKERAWALQQQQQWEREQLQLQQQSKYNMPLLTSAVHTTTYTYDTPTHASRASQHGTSNSKYHQLKRKSHESRQRLIQLSKEQLLAAFGSSGGCKDKRSRATQKLASSCSVQTLPADSSGGIAVAADGSPFKRRSTLSLQRAEQMTRAANVDDDLAQQFCHMDDDYRKNLFGTLANRGRAPMLHFAMSSSNDVSGDANAGAHYNSACGSQERENNDLSIENDETFIVNAAFDEIFAGYSGVDDDEEEVNTAGGEEQLVSLSELDDDVFKSLNSSRVNNLDCPGSTPMKLPLLKKAPPPQPPAAILKDSAIKNTAPSSTGKRTIMPLAKQKQRSTTLHNLFDRLKASQFKAKRPFGKMPSDNCPGSTPMKLPLLKKAPPPQPPAAILKASAIKNTAPSSARKRTITPLAKLKQRSTTLHNLFDRLKASQFKAKRPFAKMPSDSLLKQDQLSIEQMTHALHKYPPQLDLYRELGEGEATEERPVVNDAADQDFLRGSTLSQSFVRQLNLHQDKDKAKKKLPAPPPPINVRVQSNSASGGVNAVNGAPRPHLSQRRTKSTNELLLDDLAVQARRYQRAASRKYAAPATPKKQQTIEAAVDGGEAAPRYKQTGGSSRGHGVGADTTRSGRSTSGSYLRGSAEI
ncbi:PREDICTED: uncharacterized protein LOC108366391 [Rhagoletis zephyria]|uniref:uncharacterized protein LOC108366391 n=1 Tax=Rhagoletis zephyria TaxID=28612 RepID=UPI0008118AB7|nr:PREDICTED: uncharacterized protein LOC108366391 [Rhagoletis zephyria]